MAADSRIEIELAIRDLASSEVAKIRKDLRGFGTSVETSSKKATRGLKGTTDSTKRLTLEQKKLSTALKVGQTDLVRTGAASGVAAKGMTGAAAATKAFAVASRLIPVAGIAGALIATAKAGTDFEKAFAEVTTILDNTPEQIADLRRESLLLARELGVAPVEVARSLYQAISAGATDAAEALVVLEAGLRLSRAGLAGSETSIDGITTVLNAYGFAASEATVVSDAFFSTVRLGKTRVDEISSSLGQVAPLASQLGIDFRELLAAMAALTKQGLSTSEAVTQVRAAMVAMLKRANDINSAMQRVGGSFDLASIRSDGFAAALTDVRNAAGGSEAELVKMLGRVEAVNGVLGLTGKNAKEFADIFEQIKGGVGATDAAFEKITDTSGARLGRAFNNLRTSAGEVGESFLDASFAVIDFFTFIDDGDATTQRAIASLTEFEEILGKLSKGTALTGEEIRAVFTDTDRFNAALIEMAERAGIATDDLAKLKREVTLLQFDDALGLRLKVDFDSKQALLNLSRAAGEAVDRVDVTIPTQFGFTAEPFEQIRDILEASLEAGLDRGLGAEGIEERINAIAEGFGLLEPELAVRGEDGALRYIERFRVVVEEGVATIFARTKEFIPIDATRIPIEFFTVSDGASIIQETFPGFADGEGVLIELPLGIKVSTDELDKISDDLRLALESGVLEFTSGGTIESIRTAVLSTTKELDDDTSAALISAFASEPALSLIDAATGATIAVRDFKIETQDGARVIVPVFDAITGAVDSANAALNARPSFALVEATSDGIQITRQFVQTREELAASNGKTAVSEAEYAAEIDRVRTAVESSNKALVQKLTSSRKELQLTSQLGTAEQKRVAAIELRARTEEAGLVRSIAGGKVSLIQAARILALINQIREARLAELDVANRKRAPLVSPQSEAALAASNKRLKEIIGSVATFGRDAVIARGQFEQLQSSLRIDAFELELAEPFEREIAKIEQIARTRLAVVGELVKQGVLDEQQAVIEANAIFKVSEALIKEIRAAVESKTAREALTRAVADAQAVYETDRLAIEARTEGLTREIALINEDTKAQIENVRQREIAGEITARQARSQVDSLELIRAKTVELIEAERLRRQNLEGDDFGAGFLERLKEIGESLSAGALGAKAGDVFYGSLIDGARAFGEQIATNGDQFEEFGRRMVAVILQLIAEFTALKIAASLFANFGSPEPQPNFPSDEIFGSGSGLPAPAPSFFAKGGVMKGKLMGHAPYGGGTLPVRAYASGGIANSPQLAVFAEKPGVAEAFVPLPDGRNIPVRIKRDPEARGANQPNVAATISLRVESLDPSRAADVVLAQMPKIQKELTAAIQKGTDRSLSKTVGRRR